METIKINGKDYTVEAIELGAELAAKGRRVYGLTGKRGAQYAAVQYINRPDMYHVIRADFGGSAPMPGVVLTDTSGRLEVAK